MSLRGSQAAAIVLFVCSLLSGERNWTLSLEIPFVERDHFDSHLYSYTEVIRDIKRT